MEAKPKTEGNCASDNRKKRAFGAVVVPPARECPSDGNWRENIAGMDSRDEFPQFECIDITEANSLQKRISSARQLIAESRD
jgi:hypothetical protein